MQPSRRGIVLALGSLPLLGGFALTASAQAQLRAGTDYSELRVALPVESPPGKIEVIEFFWYGCPHCYSLEPSIEAWVKKLQPDTVFRRVPAVFNERWARDAAIFYAFEAMGVADKLHRPLFDAIHREGLKTENPDALRQWLDRRGVDSKKFEEALKSFGVQSQVKRAQQLSVVYRIEGTPTMGVQGRYTVSSEQGKSREGVLANVDYLIGLARSGGKK
jgi:thiol:disulfide interchange protein DsbA